MSTAIQTLAEFAVGLRHDALPADVVERAKTCVVDTVAVASYGATAPWMQPLIRYARRPGRDGACSLLGVAGAKVDESMASLVNGTAAHAFEQDSLRSPSAGVHPGATLVPSGLAAAQAAGAGGRDLLAAFVAGVEVMFRIGTAAHHSTEALGFHAPGVTGAYGAAVVAGRLFGLDAPRMADALGIAASLGGGLLAFSRAQRGGEVKRLHFGRAAEAGILAARLAAEGHAGPETALDGRFGYLEAYCRDGDPAEFTRALGETWETLNICLKRYPCHITAHTPVEAMAALRAEHGFGPDDIEAIVVRGSERMATRNDIRDPADVPQAQYSVPFCLALSLYRDAENPASFDAGSLVDPAIRAMVGRIELVQAAPGELPSAWATHTTVRLADGRTLALACSRFPGMPGVAIAPDALRTRFLKLTRSAGVPEPEVLFDRLSALESQPRLVLP